MKKDLVSESSGKDVIAQNEVTDPGYEQSEDVSILEKEKSAVHDSVGNRNEDLIQVIAHTEFGAEIENLKSKTEVEQNDCHEAYQGMDNSSGDEQPIVTDEVDFKISTIVSALSNQTIIKNLCWLLKFYKSNSLDTNHYIISMLRRVCEDLELSPMLYQLSFLTTFYDILEEQKSKPCKEHENVVLFLTDLVRRMLRKMKTRPLLFVEVLFWKTRRECHLINAECMLNTLGNLKKEIREGGLNGEMGLSGREGWVRRSIADALGDDEADITTFHEEVGEKNESFGEGRESIVSSSSDEANEKENDSRDGHSFEKMSEGLRKIRKPLVLNDELEGKFRDLYEKYKKEENCYHLIANALDEYGVRISPIQVSRTLKKLGLQLVRKRKMSVAGSADEFRDGAITHLNVEGSSSLRKPLHIRKRVRAFSEDQEQRIKDLFEQFKYHKRCSYMIAKTLDAKGSVSTAQVSRKLKQLGIFVPRKKRSDTNFHLRDDGSSELSAGSADDSDNETLISLKRRSKSETKYASRQNEGTVKQLSQDNSDDELLRSFLPSKNQQNETEIAQKQSHENGGKSSEKVSGHDELLRDATEQSAEVGTLEMGPGTSEHAGFAETEGLSRVNQSKIAPVNEADNGQPQKVHDELADLEDEVSLVESQRSIASRRYSRMIMDLDDYEY